MIFVSILVLEATRSEQKVIRRSVDSQETMSSGRNYPDPGMQSLLTAARRYSESTNSDNGDSMRYSQSRSISGYPPWPL